MAKDILLIEPGYKNKYPPLGLMKISQYHKRKGDRVEFFKGLSPQFRDKTEWDRIYVSSLFTFHWSQTMEALKYYRYSVKDPYSDNLVVGGVLATELADEILAVVKCRVVKGLLDEKGKLGYDDDDVIDSLVPDYSILDTVSYRYPTSNAYIAYMTRGCIRTCGFCTVHLIEPEFKHYLPIGAQIDEISERYGPRKDLILLDNNVLASNRFEQIIDDIKTLGFERGAKFSYQGKQGNKVTAHRWVDFNQGLDARLLTENKMALLSEVALRPLRLAFDDIGYKDLYLKKVRLAARFGIRYLSNYVLFNYDDRPEDMYLRLRLNVELNEELGLQVYSFPMRYVGLRSKDRNPDTPGNLGRHWNKKYLRALQCILVATHGIVGPSLSFFEAAFGTDVEEFKRILLMPEDYIVHRRAHEADGSTEQWWRQLRELSGTEYDQFSALVEANSFRALNWLSLSGNVRAVLEHYIENDHAQLPLFV